MQAVKSNLVETLRAIIKPHSDHWVLFKNDSFIIFEEKPENIEDRALEIIRYYGSQRQGGTTSDYEATPVEGKEAWLVCSYYQGLFTYVRNSEVESHAPAATAASIKGREKRQLDGQSPIIVHIESV